MNSYFSQLLPDHLKRILRSVRARWLLTKADPASRNFGFDRGMPISRYYTEQFLEPYRSDITGRVLEIGVPIYAHRFGQQVTQCDVLDNVPENTKANITGDLVTGEGMPVEKYDCLIVTGVYLFTYNLQAAIINSMRALRPGGVLLATLPGIAQVFRTGGGTFGDYWRFTDSCAERLFGDVFGPQNVRVVSFGNVLTASAYLHGLATEEFTQAQLNRQDPDYQLCIGVHARKAR